MLFAVCVCLSVDDSDLIVGFHLANGKTFLLVCALLCVPSFSDFSPYDLVFISLCVLDLYTHTIDTDIRHKDLRTREREKTFRF